MKFIRDIINEKKRLGDSQKAVAQIPAPSREEISKPPVADAPSAFENQPAFDADAFAAPPRDDAFETGATDSADFNLFSSDDDGASDDVLTATRAGTRDATQNAFLDQPQDDPVAAPPVAVPETSPLLDGLDLSALTGGSDVEAADPAPVGDDPEVLVADVPEKAVADIPGVPDMPAMPDMPKTDTPAMAEPDLSALDLSAVGFPKSDVSQSASAQDLTAAPSPEATAPRTPMAADQSASDWADPPRTEARAPIPPRSQVDPSAEHVMSNSFYAPRPDQPGTPSTRESETPKAARAPAQTRVQTPVQPPVQTPGQTPLHTQPLAAPRATAQPEPAVSARNPDQPVQVPSPAAGRGSRRAGRVKTRLLGFNAAQDEAADPFAANAPKPKAQPEAAAPATPMPSLPPEFPVGWLVVVSGPGRGASFTLFAGVAQIGRGSSQTVRLDFGDSSISRENHAAIAYDPEQRRFYLGHGGKANLVRLNDRPVLSTEELKTGHMIRLGETTLRFTGFCGTDFDWDAAPDSDLRHASFG